jgi:NADPH2:quinone reductase
METQKAAEARIQPRNLSLSLTQFGGVDGFELVEQAMPVPGPGEVRVRTLAASVQFTDVILRRGDYPDLKQKPPLTLGYDIVGEVEAIGPGVEGIAIGDRVADLTMIGSYTKHRLLDANKVVPVPRDVDPAKATALVLGWMTAYQLLHRHAKVKRGQTVLVQGAAGSVGQALVELGTKAGLKIYGTCRAEHADLVESLGAIPIDYRRERLADVVPEGFDVVFDGIAENGYRTSWRAVKRGGFLSAYGLSAAIKAGYGLLRTGLWFVRPFIWNALPNGKRAGFYSITSMREQHPEWFREDLSQLFAMLGKGEIAPRIEARIGLSDIPAAHAQLESGGLTGKLVLVP